MFQKLLIAQKTSRCINSAVENKYRPPPMNMNILIFTCCYMVTGEHQFAGRLEIFPLKFTRYWNTFKIFKHEQTLTKS